MGISAKAALHGAIDSTFAAKTAIAAVNPTSTVWADEEHAKIVALRDQIDGKLAVEVNRIEGQLSLMLSHVEGELESKLANANLRRWYAPLILGIVVGIVLTVTVSVLSR